MPLQQEKPGYLILADGQVFQGRRRGSTEKTPIAELVFTTGMTGYMETLTDPSYFGQIVVQTFPLIGNCGFIGADRESPAPALSGYVVGQLCDVPSNFRSQGPLNAWLREQGVPVLEGVDTRQITRAVRQSGVMNAIISDTPTLTDTQRQALQAYKVQNAVASVTCKATHTTAPVTGASSPSDSPSNHSQSTPPAVRSGSAAASPAAGSSCLSATQPSQPSAQSAPPAATPKVILYHLGAKSSIARCLAARGCTVVTVPAATPAAEVLAHRPNGILLSNGPGDPTENTTLIRNIAALFQSGIPLFGICLGHQLMALAHGARTRKMKFGHRGANQPVQNTETGRAWLTCQNHGYCVVGESLGAGASELYLNANDGTCEGVRYHQFPGFSVQFHPEAAAGPLDTGFLFDEFISLMREVNANA